MMRSSIYFVSTFLPSPSVVGTTSELPPDDTEDEVFPLDDCVFACSSPPIKMFDCKKGRPHRSIFLSRRQQSVNLLLDSGANVNVLNFLTCLRLRIPIRRTPTGSIGRIGGKTPIFGKIKLELLINDSFVHTYFHIIEDSPNLIGCQLINKFNMFENMSIAQ